MRKWLLAVVTGIIYAILMTSIFFALRFGFAKFSFSNGLIVTVCVGAFFLGVTYSSCDEDANEETKVRFASILAVVACVASWLVQRLIS